MSLSLTFGHLYDSTALFGLRRRPCTIIVAFSVELSANNAAAEYPNQFDLDGRRWIQSLPLLFAVQLKRFSIFPSHFVALLSFHSTPHVVHGASRSNDQPSSTHRGLLYMAFPGASAASLLASADLSLTASTLLCVTLP